MSFYWNENDEDNLIFKGGMEHVSSGAGDDPKEVPKEREEQMGHHVKQIATLHRKPRIGATCSNITCHFTKVIAV
ncbi:hypothetical protein CRYUN_Cryun33cG0110400 [Craigia yunnanensis]